MKLTTYQINILLPFFINSKYTGSESIGKKLLEIGKCIVAGNECIWKGGIGNFIKTKPAENAVDCLLYELDIVNFIKSKWVEEYLQEYTKSLEEKICNLSKQIDTTKEEVNDLLILLKL